ncbi:hypothetical protein SAMN06272759_105263 [Novosphingobium sp. B1]|nr:hypothetical protein SAMN06272759_105263 [Novosphingobium sp. B1]
MELHEALTGRLRKHLAASFGAFAFFSLAPVSAAADEIATSDASASLAIVEPVGAGFSYDIANDAVSAVFLVGDNGDSASMLLSRRKPAPTEAAPNTRIASGVIVMASGVYRIDLLTPVSSELRRPLPPLMRASVPGGGSILFLAQFN